MVAGVIGCGFDTPAPPEVLPKVFFTADHSLTDESVATQTIPVKLSMKSDDVVTVGYSVTGGTAKVGSDVRDAEGEITFAPFQDTAMLTLTVIDDGIEEDHEDLELTLKSPDNAELGEQIKHVLTINKNILPRVRFVAPTSSAGEQTGAQSFALQLDRLTPEDVVVRYSWSGTSEPTDHGVTDSLVTIRANQISETIPAPIVNDPTDEDDETIDLVLIAQAGAIVAPGLGQHVHTIVDDDLPPTVNFTPAAATASEAAGTVSLEVTLSLASEKPITVDFAGAAGGSAGAEDATVTGGTLAFPPGTTSQTVTVTITDDALDEDDETFRTALANPSNATLQDTTRLHTLTITDDDDPPTIEFELAASTASEATATHTVNVELSAPSGRTVQFSLSRAGTSTTADLTLPATTFSIPPGATSLAISATVLNDTIDDDNETAILTLTGLVNAGAGAQSTHTITIADDDGPPTVRFDPQTADQAENERDQTTGTYIYRVILSAPSNNQVTVPVAVGGTAMNNDYDIGANDIPVVFQPGQTQKEIRVIVSPDGTVEADETVTLTLGTATNATNAADNQARTHTIVNDD